MKKVIKIPAYNEKQMEKTYLRLVEEFGQNKKFHNSERYKSHAITDTKEVRKQIKKT